jgi:hypothetical protein
MMRIVFYKDGSFSFAFDKDEAELGAGLVSLIQPADQDSANYLNRAYRTLIFLHNHGYLPDTPANNVYPFKPKDTPH